MKAGNRTGKLITGPTAVFVTVLFFLPWLSLTYENHSLGSFSGLTLALGAGSTAFEGPIIPPLQGDLSLLAIFVLANTTLDLLLLTLWKPAWNRLILRLALAATGLALALWLFKWQQWQSSSFPGFRLSFLPAFWGTAVGLAVMLAGILFDLLSASPAATDAIPADLEPEFKALPTANPLDPTPSRLQPNLVKKRTRPVPARDEVTDPVAWLVVTGGSQKGQSFRLQAETSIGRSPECDIVLQDTALSGRHACVLWENGRFVIHDQNSKNGLLIFDVDQNRWQKKARTYLADGTRIKVGRTILQLITLPEQTEK